MSHAPAAIDVANGHVRFSSPQLEIAPDWTLDAFMASPLFKQFESLTQNPPWALYGFRDFEAAHERWAGSICFQAGALQWITLSMLRAEFGTSWADFSKEKELRRQLAHDEWLMPQLAQSTPT